jgi:NADPH-dependent curcumin reductase
MDEGKIKVQQDVVDGLENAVETVKKLYTGANTGKLMINVKDV